MPRDIPVGNGHMLVCFDQHYRVRDLYFPYVGQENHGGGPCRFGVWGEIPESQRAEDERRKKRVFWTDDGWDIDLRYQPDTLATDVTLRHQQLQVELRCTDVVDFNRPVMVRRIEVCNLLDVDRELRLVHHQDFHMYGTKVGDTAYFDPMLRSMIHYRKVRYLMACFYADGDPQIDEYATGTAGFRGAEGTWRDAEDGKLGNNPIAQGAVDSTILTKVQVPAGGMRVVYLILGAGKSFGGLEDIYRFLHRTGPQGAIDRTTAYWRQWLDASHVRFPDQAESGLSERVEDLYRRSLLVVRTQIDNGGAIIAANDSDIMQFQRDTYSYLWPRDGAFVADAVDAAGFTDVARQFFELCAQLLNKRGMYLHKFNPDGSVASSWHPWVMDGRPVLPIQEDETALVVWALWRHYERHRDVEFVRRLWIRLIQPAADFLVRYRDPATKLPLPSYDLWEERYGVHAFTVASVYAGLKAAWQFAVCFGDAQRARRYAAAAEEVRAAFCKHLWSAKHGRFLRRVVPTDMARVSAFMDDILNQREPRDDDGNLYADLMPDTDTEVAAAADVEADVEAAGPDDFEHDDNIDASMYAIFALGLLPVGDERVKATMDAIADRLWVKTEVGGVARYEDDYYHQVTRDTDRVPGNPWFICTLWLAQYHIAAAQDVAGLKKASELLDWVADGALPSGVLAEQVHPMTNDPLSVSPLTWSHATVVSTVLSYLQRLNDLKGSDTNPVQPKPLVV